MLDRTDLINFLELHDIKYNKSMESALNNFIYLVKALDNSHDHRDT
jgi:hypothetical protein